MCVQPTRTSCQSCHLGTGSLGGKGPWRRGTTCPGGALHAGQCCPPNPGTVGLDRGCWPRVRASVPIHPVSSHTPPRWEARARWEGWAPYLDHLEAQEASVQHDDLILVCALVYHMPQGQQLLLVGQHGAPPGRVALMADDHFLLKGLYGLVEDHGVFVLVGASELVLGKEVHLWVRRTRELAPGGCKAKPTCTSHGCPEWMEDTLPTQHPWPRGRARQGACDLGAYDFLRQRGHF